MNGLLRRLTRRRAATADENPPGTPAASEPVDATVVSFEERSPLSEEEQAREEELLRRRRDVPAGVDPDRLEAPAGESARRGALRRRVRYLRSVREVLLRDLGGFFYEIHRAAGASHGGHRDLLETKAGRLVAVDEELGQLEARLGEAHPAQTVVREPGVGGTCRTCGELHGSDAAWCARCGSPLSERARKRREQEVDRTIASRQAEAAERTRDAERAREAAAASTGAAKSEPADGASPSGTPSGDAPAGETPAGETPAGGTPAGDAPTSELPAARRRPGGEPAGDPVTTPGERP